MIRWQIWQPNLDGLTQDFGCLCCEDLRQILEFTLACDKHDFAR